MPETHYNNIIWSPVLINSKTMSNSDFDLEVLISAFLNSKADFDFFNFRGQSKNSLIQ